MYSESDIITISKAIIENDYEAINDNYKELSKYFTSLKVIVDNYMAIEEDNNPFWESRLNLTFVHNVICSFNYIEKTITSDDTDTIKVLLKVSRMDHNSYGSIIMFQKLFIIIFGNPKFVNSDFVTIQSLNEVVTHLIKNHEKIKFDGLNVSEKFRKLYDICPTIKNDIDLAVNFLHSCLTIFLTIYGTLNNNFEYLYKYLDNQEYYVDYLYHNCFINKDFEGDTESYNFYMIYNSIEDLFSREIRIIQ